MADVNGGRNEEQQVLLLAIAIERYCARMYQDWAHRFSAYDNGTSVVLGALAQEELKHERELMDLYVALTGREVPEPLPAPPAFKKVSQRLQALQEHFFVVDAAMAETMVELALEIERYTQAFYTQLQNQVDDPRAAALLRRLMEFEGEHVGIFLERL